MTQRCPPDIARELRDSGWNSATADNHYWRHPTKQSLMNWQIAIFCHRERFYSADFDPKGDPLHGQP